MAHQRSEFRRKVRWSSGSEIHFQSEELSFAPDASARTVYEAASDQGAISLVSDQALTMFVEGVGGSGRTDNLLYIIKERDHSRACKIGYTCKPLERLANLQTGTWREMHVAAVFCPVDANIEKLERAIHCAAERRGLTLRGEWLSASPIEATELILEFARKKGYALCGPEAWIENLGARVKGLRKAQLDRREDYEAIARLAS